MRVYFDASVLIVALLSPTGGSSQLFKYIRVRRIIGITSQTVIEEVVEEEKFAKLKKSKDEVESFIAQSGLVIRKRVTSEDITPYEGFIEVEDAHLVVGATRTKCAYLVTLDKKHLLRKDIQEKFLPLRIVSPKELLEEMISD